MEEVQIKRESASPEPTIKLETIKEEYNVDEVPGISLVVAEYNTSILDIEGNTGEKLFSCNLCDFAATGQNVLISHLKAIHKSECTVQCDKCNMKFSSKQVLEKHFRKTHSEKPFKCELCSKGYSNKAILNRHSCTPSRQKTSCKICGKVYRSLGSMAYHLLKHKGEKPFACGVCGFRCYRKDYLDTHLITHLNSLPKNKTLICYACNQKFKLKEELREHTKLHMGDFVCKICSRRFNTKDSLISHLKTYIPTI